MKKNSIFTVILGVYFLFSVHSAIPASAASEDVWLNTDTWLQKSSSGANGGGIGGGETPTGDEPTVGNPVGQLPAVCLLLLSGAYIAFKKRKRIISKITC